MARPLSGLLVRHAQEGLVDGTGESEEIEFNIPRGLAIEIFGLRLDMKTGDLDGALIEVDGLIDVDGPSLAGNAINTQALFDARQILASNLHSVHFRVDNVTEGASVLSTQSYIALPFPVLTARNLGMAGISLGGSGEVFASIYYRWVEITTAEFITLVADLRT